ncbi:Y-family DNA polymerase [Aestuariivirga sp.]|uniref:Y-family DNA polymerase n=1 Tax=Aestuariivirga sp. TaxID=2650926 RepID=UPI0039E3B47D
MMAGSGRRRLLALWFPFLPAERLRRHEGAARPFVIAAKERNVLRIFALGRAAARLGLQEGQPLANARAMVPGLEVIPANPHADALMLERLAGWCGRFTPLVSLDRPYGLILDITGASHLFGGEKAMMRKASEGLQVRGFSAQAAIAGTAMAARALARHRTGLITPEGSEAEAVSPLPIDALQLDAVTTHAFRRAGLKTIGQSAGRKRSELMARFGASTLAVIDEALGKSVSPTSPLPPPPEFWRARHFAEPVATLEVIRAALAALSAELAAVMEREGVGARALDAAFFRADGALRRIAIETGAPVRAVAVIDRLFREKLASLADPLDPGFGFDVIRLAAIHVEAMPVEAVSLDSAAQEEQDIAFLIDRLAARFGRARVQRFHPRETHVPERAWVMKPAQEDVEASPWRGIRGTGEPPRRPLRLFERPEPVEVESPPLRLSWRKVTRCLIQWEGPERIAMEWWRKKEEPRDYYRAEDEEGRRYWLYCEAARQPPQWFLHGLFA